VCVCKVWLFVLFISLVVVFTRSFILIIILYTRAFCGCGIAGEIMRNASDLSSDIIYW
jgi:hypothetical protein